MIKTVERFDAICDICGKSAGVAFETPEEASIAAVRRGWASVVGQHFCPSCKIPTAKRRNGRVYPALRMLEVGDYVVVPLRSWQSARSAASKIKHDFGSVFEVHRVLDDIYVTRKK